MVAIAKAYGTSVAYLLGEIESPESLVPMYRTQPQVQGEEKVSGSKELLFPSVQNNDLSVYSPAQLAVQLKNSFVTHPFVIITEKAHMENCLRYTLRLVRGLHRIGDNLGGFQET
ncbi:hypothetical protein [Cloacibacillus sp.]|uniref:hypothetical protein n=1 Tax=Cloacibacillus sp. TaxID=2049023 RepID=UPI0025BD1E41|nr:hypothetical protein [Cloacibacillus sp.]